jgi:glycosyltransferase involved in cell wall biosynthesis
MHRRGHEVSLVVHNGGVSSWEGIPIYDSSRLDVVERGWDVVFSWNEPDLLRRVQPPSLRMVNQQLNDFNYADAGFDSFVDVYTSPSESHKAFHQRGAGSMPHLMTTSAKWEVLPNGCDPDQYKDVPRVPGRVIYASSPDRGLHLLLQCWPAIRRAVPQAHLKIFYNIDDWLDRLASMEHHPHMDIQETSCRARYVKNALQKMSHLGVEKVGSSSRLQMAEELSRAVVLAYPCDTICFTEGFSVTSMEACAAGVFPVISSVDSLGQIYGGNVPMVQTPVRENLGNFTDLVVRGLTDAPFRHDAVDRARSFSRGFTWSTLAGQLERIVERRRR